jgi:hypothetical protein
MRTNGSKGAQIFVRGIRKSAAIFWRETYGHLADAPAFGGAKNQRASWGGYIKGREARKHYQKFGRWGVRETFPSCASTSSKPLTGFLQGLPQAVVAMDTQRS